MEKKDIIGIAGVELDFGEVLAAAKARVLSQADHEVMTYGLEQRRMILRGVVWTELVSRAGELLCLDQAPKANAEMAVAEAMRRGVKKEDVHFRKKSFIFPLGHTLFMVRKRTEGYAASPEQLGGFGAVEMGQFAPAAFADLIFAFDSRIPVIDAQTALLQESISSLLMEREKARRAEQIKMKAVKTLIGDFLTPLGVSCHPVIDGDRVVIEMTLIKKGTITANLEDLPGVLKDAEEIVRRMETDAECRQKLRIMTKMI